MPLSDCAIVGYAETKIVDKTDKDVWELGAEVLESILASTKLEKQAIDAALTEVYQRIEAVEFDAVERGRTPRDKLARLLESYFEFLDAEPEPSVVAQWVSRMSARP